MSLQALDRDLLGTLYCLNCNQLHFIFVRHEVRLLRAEQIYRRVPECRCPISDGTCDYRTFYNYHARFKFEHVQMAMKLYRHGLLSDAKAYLKCLAFLRPNRQRINAFPTNLGLSFFEPRFVKDQIFVRAQSWILIPEDQGSIMPKLRFTRVCEHLDSPYDTSPYSMIFQCKLEHFADKQDLTEICCILIRCRYCPTALLVEAKRLNKDSKGGLLTINKWQDLGCGLSPSEARWKSHLECPGTPWPYPPDDELGSIRAQLRRSAWNEM